MSDLNPKRNGKNGSGTKENSSQDKLHLIQAHS